VIRWKHRELRAAGLLATAPLTTPSRTITDDPGTEPPVRWIAVTGWIVAIALILGVSIALLFPFGVWLIALGVTWKNDEPVPGPHDGSLFLDALQRRRVE